MTNFSIILKARRKQEFLNVDIDEDNPCIILLEIRATKVRGEQEWKNMLDMIEIHLF